MTGVAVLIIFAFIAVPTLAYLASWSAERQAHAVRLLDEARIDQKTRELRAMQLELGRQAHDMDTMIKATVNSVADDTTIHDPDDWEEL